jgi:hypothetical protein
MTISLAICVKIHKATKVLTNKSYLTPNEELGKTISMEKLVKKIQQHINQRLEKDEATMKVTIGLMEEHLIQPTKVKTMIQAFMATLVRDMKALTDNSTSHDAALEEILYQRIISLNGKYEVWVRYVNDKNP